jgi:hypothetical protein
MKAGKHKWVPFWHKHRIANGFVPADFVATLVPQSDIAPIKHPGKPMIHASGIKFRSRSPFGTRGYVRAAP